MSKLKQITEYLNEHNSLIKKITKSRKLKSDILNFIREGISTIKNKRKIIFFGNGGSAADSQHLATELVVRYKKNRKSIPALSLTTDTSMLTAIGNDISFESVFTRQLEAVANKGDLIIPISTSGNSKNIISAVKYCLKNKINTIPLLGNNGGQISMLVKKKIIIPSNSTARIQECHILIGHIFCEELEKNIILKQNNLSK